MMPGARGRLLRLAWQVPAVTAIWFSILQWPAPPTAELDPSWNLILGDAWLHGRQFGRDIIFTWGPLGFLFPPFVLAEIVPLKVVAELIVRLFVAMTVVEIASSLDIVRRAILVASVACFGVYFPDAVFNIAMLALVTRWLLAPDASAGKSAAGLVALAFLSLIKFTYLAVAVAGVAVSAAASASAGRWRSATALIGGYSAALLFLWTAAGQEVASLPPFVWFSANMSGGYPQAMSSDETWQTFGIGMAIMSVFTTWIGAWAWPRRRSPEALATAAIVAIGIFLAWKHGFTRGAGHATIFLGGAVFLATGMPALLRGARSPWPLAIVLVLAISGLWDVIPDAMKAAPARTWGRIVHSADRVTDWSWRRTLEAQAAARREFWSFPRTASVVGSQTIDVIDYEQGISLLNGLNYHPRPVPQSYVAYTPALLGKNLDFIESARAPRYLLVGSRAIDGRYLGQTDSLVLAELPRRYQPILVERGYILLQRRAVQPPPASQVLTPLLSVSVRPGEAVELPDEPGHALWMQVDSSLSPLGRLRSLFYKPPMLRMTAENESARATLRLIPGIARAGFVLQPFLFDQQDLTAFLRGSGVRRARRVRIDAAEGEDRYWGHFDVRVFRMESLPLQSRLPE